MNEGLEIWLAHKLEEGALRVMNDYYPPGVSELPGEKDEIKTYIFEIYGEVEVEAYTEEDAEEELKNSMKESLYDAYLNGDIEIK